MCKPEHIGDTVTNELSNFGDTVTNTFINFGDIVTSNADKYALLIEGARRVGKTHLVQEFVQKEYESSMREAIKQLMKYGKYHYIETETDADIIYLPFYMAHCL